MQDFFEWGEYFLSAISKIGDFLLYKPFAGADVIEKYDFLLSAKNKFVLMNDVDAYADISIGGILLGTSLILILTFKIAKFFLDIIT